MFAFYSDNFTFATAKERKKKRGGGEAVILQGQNQLYSDTTEFHLCLFALFLLVWLFPWLTDKIFAVTERRTWNLRRPAQVTFAPTKLPATSDAAKARSSCVSAQLIISLQKYRLFLQLRKLRLKRARLWQQTHTGNHWRALCRDKTLQPQIPNCSSDCHFETPQFISLRLTVHAFINKLLRVRFADSWLSSSHPCCDRPFSWIFTRYGHQGNRDGQQGWNGVLRGRRRDWKLYLSGCRSTIWPISHDHRREHVDHVRASAAVVTTFSRAVPWRAALTWLASLEWVQQCCTELFHAFSPDHVNVSVAQLNRKTRSDRCFRQFLIQGHGSGIVWIPIRFSNS